MTIRLATPEDAGAIAEIYAPYVTGSAVSFETEPPDAAMVRERMAAGDGLYPWLVFEEPDGTIAGYAYATQFRARRAYRFTVEATVYVRGDRHGRGIGARLYETLFALLTDQGFTQAIVAITLPNDPSIKLHRAQGFTEAGVYRDVGHKLAEWRSVAIWQRPLAPPAANPAEPRPVHEAWRG
ncbi:N-acetyltransferase family protein [Sphingosinicella sp. LHD-64]|uniref:GNAT family N-acetyltransferase n=1 Tax=Sphingosinicella sp. LHD-64 TaxID=3072139 RepID=UPI00280E5AC3|nr:N-acetyltransferase family protein [Sphingosinicella sp. LHD-64]MDQ8756339.1 N-acetyltransferase family protein [Sphingosinicella sp. LHD-64]